MKPVGFDLHNRFSIESNSQKTKIIINAPKKKTNESPINQQKTIRIIQLCWMKNFWGREHGCQNFWQTEHRCQKKQNLEHAFFIIKYTWKTLVYSHITLWCVKKQKKMWNVQPTSITFQTILNLVSFRSCILFSFSFLKKKVPLYAHIYPHVYKKKLALLSSSSQSSIIK
jgi:hypothetical protein